MSRPPDWTDDERDALGGLEADLDVIRQRHAGDPPLELLRAGRASSLPEPLQGQISTHLDESAWSRALVDGLDDALPAQPLDNVTEMRILARLRAVTDAGRPAWHGWAAGGLAVAAALILAVFVVTGRSGSLPRLPAESAAPASEVTARSGAPAPVPNAPVTPASPATSETTLAFARAEIKLSAAALTWRGAAEANPYLQALKPALDAYRDGRDEEADRLFAALAGRFPAAVEVAYFHGVTRMLLGDFGGAVPLLARAVALDDVQFTEDATWYLAVAEHNAGRHDAARVRLQRLCRESGARRAEACAAVDRLAGPPPVP